MRFFRHQKRFPFSIALASLAAGGVFVLLAARSGGAAPGQELAWLQQLAAGGDAGAGLQLGLAYRDGRYGLDPDPGRALHWLAAAGEAGDAYAADLVGNAYANGEGTTRDLPQARRWWQRAAAAGNADAQRRLGESLLADDRSEQGVTWLRDAADRGDRRAHADLAALYRHRELPDADLHRGENPVAALGARLDATGVNALFTAWHTLTRNTPPVQSVESLLGRARQGDPLAEYQLAMRYRNGSWAVKRDPHQAMVWLQRSADAGNRVAAQTLSDIRHDHNTGPAATAPPASTGISRT